MKYNIYEAFLYKFKQFILGITYIPGFDISNIIDDISKTFSLIPIKLNDDFNLDNKNLENFNKKVNNIIEENNLRIKSNFPIQNIQGILIYGLTLPDKLLSFNINFHLHLSLNKEMYKKLNKNADIKEYNNFQKLLENNKIHKYYNIKTELNKKLNNNIFDKIVDFIEFKLYGKDYNIFSTAARKKKKSLKENYLESDISEDIDESKSSDNSNESNEIILDNSEENIFESSEIDN